MNDEEKKARRLEYVRKYREANREKLRDRARARRLNKRDHVNELRRANYANAPQRHIDYVRNYVTKNKEKRALAQKEYFQKNKNELNRKRRLRYAQNPEAINRINKKWLCANKNRKSSYDREWKNKNRQKVRESSRRQRENLTNSYIAYQLKLDVPTLKKYPLLIEAKKEQLKIFRELKPQTRKQTQCTRTPAHCNKSATTSLKPLTPHGSTSLLSLDLSSWSTPWVRQLIPLLSKSKLQR